MEVHHKLPKGKGGTDQYQNLIYVLKGVHKTYSCNKGRNDTKISCRTSIDEKELRKVNALRKKAGNYVL